MHHAAATQPTSRRFVWLSGALPIPDPVPRSSGQNRRAGFWFLCVPGLEPIANAMSWLLSRRSYSLRCRLTPPATRTWRLHAVLHVISAIHAQLLTADCICCVLKSHFMPHLPFMQIAFNWIYLASTPYLFLLRVSRICIGRSRRRDGCKKRLVVERFLVVGLYLHRGIKSLLFCFLCTFAEFSSI